MSHLHHIITSLAVLTSLGSVYPVRTWAAEGKPALTVELTRAQRDAWPLSVPATGSISAWQETVIGAEAGGQRLTDVLVEVGQRVRKGQLLARIFDGAANADVAQAEAMLRESNAMLTEAQANAQRARSLREKGFYSPQTGTQFLTAEQTAEARAAAAKAALDAARVRQAQTRIIAPDDGLISARQATVGSLTQQGQELFRLIRQGRLEWRAEIPEAQLHRVRPGMSASLTVSGGAPIKGKVRNVAPAVDPKTRNGIAYVDVLNPGDTARAGMFVRGELELGSSPALHLPQTALVMRDGYSYVYVAAPVQGDMAQVRATKVQTGRRAGSHIEIIEGITSDAAVVARGAGFLADGDTVRLAPATK